VSWSRVGGWALSASLWIFYVVWGFVIWQDPDTRYLLAFLGGSLIWVIIARWRDWRSKRRERAGTGNREATASDDEDTHR
jgi:hypothetical protein